MDRNTPALDAEGRAELLRSHLSNELEWLLRAATKWHAEKAPGSTPVTGHEVQVFAMDSALLHARVLFEFFTKRTSRNCYGVTEFSFKEPLESALYTGWADPLHAFLMHLQFRGRPNVLERSDGITLPLNEMPVEIARNSSACGAFSPKHLWLTTIQWAMSPRTSWRPLSSTPIRSRRVPL